MNIEERKAQVSLARDIVAAMNEFVGPFVFLNAIYRNINSGENTVAFRYDPNTGDFAGPDRFTGYGRPKRTSPSP